MHWLLFIHKVLFSSTCFEPQVLFFRQIKLYTCSICYCHTLWELLVACRYTAWVRTQAVYRQATRNSHREWQYHMLHVYNCIVLKMNTWGSKHVEENSKLDFGLTVHHLLGKVIQMNQLNATMIYWSIRSAQHVSGNILPIIRRVRLRYLQHMVFCCCGG